MVVLPNTGICRPIRRSAAWAPLVLITLVAAIYLPTLWHDFVDLDDFDHVRQNAQIHAGLTWEGVRWAVVAPHFANWTPLTWISHMADCALYGLRPGGHHLTNLLLHAASTVLLFRALLTMSAQAWPSFLVAGLFAVHPIHVESVAWVAERKGALSTLFWMATLLAYAHYIRHPTTWRYVAVAACLVAGLMAKQMLVTLPFALLLLDYWPLRRFRIRPSEVVQISIENHLSIQQAPDQREQVIARPPINVVVEKLPLLFVIAAFSVIAYLAQQSGGTIASLTNWPMGVRLQNVLISYVVYLGKLLWPRRLAVYYPYSPDPTPLWLPAAAALFLLVVSVWVYAVRNRRPYALVGWSWYLSTFIPVIGFIPLGSSVRADRYAYIPAVGIYLAVVWRVFDWAGNSTHRLRWVRIFGCFAVGAFAAQAAVQVQIWRDSETLLLHALSVTEKNFVVQNDLGLVRFEQGRMEEAEQFFRASIASYPRYFQAQFNLARVLLATHRDDDALAVLRQILREEPRFALAHQLLGMRLAIAGNLRAAEFELRESVRLAPQDGTAAINLGSFYLRSNDYIGARLYLQRGLTLEPLDPVGHLNLALVLLHDHDQPAAAKELRTVLQLDPTNESAIRLLDKLEKGNLHLPKRQ